MSTVETLIKQLQQQLIEMKTPHAEMEEDGDEEMTEIISELQSSICELKKIEKYEEAMGVSTPTNSPFVEDLDSTSPALRISYSNDFNERNKPVKVYRPKTERKHNLSDGYDYLKIKLDFENIKSLDVGTNLYSRKQIILPDLSCKTTLTSFQSNCYVTPGKLPTSIIKSTILVNYYNPYRQGDESIPALTNLQLLRSRSFPVDKYSTLTNLTSLVVDKHYPLDEYDLFHYMSMFNKLVDIDLGISVSLPILPTSVTKFIVEINTQLTPTHYSNYSYLTNLHVLSITHSPQITSLPTSLRELVIITKTKQPHDLSRLSLTKFEFGYGEKQNEYEPEFIFPTTLKDVKLEILTTNSFKIPDFRETTNLVSCSIVCNIEKDCDKFFGNMFLPNSLKTFKFVNRCFDRHTIPIEFENIDNTQLPNEEKNNFSMLMRGSQWSNYFQNPVTWML
ncbi:hypothetical protein QTN25_000127 [Entamoeba marina]